MAYWFNISESSRLVLFNESEKQTAHNIYINCIFKKNKKSIIILTFIFMGRVLVMLTKAALASVDQSLPLSRSHGTVSSRRQIVDSRG